MLGVRGRHDHVDHASLWTLAVRRHAGRAARAARAAAQASRAAQQHAGRQHALRDDGERARDLGQRHVRHVRHEGRRQRPVRRDGHVGPQAGDLDGRRRHQQRRRRHDRRRHRL